MYFSTLLFCEEVNFMISRMDVVTDVARLYDVAAAEDALIEIELDTQQLRALTEEEARLLMSEELVAGHPDTHACRCSRSERYAGSSAAAVMAGVESERLTRLDKGFSPHWAG